ncbi:MAG TPA: fructosamine kinase family protein [Trebonia sp.]|nr:fructosamine kinase family protein [Trebonia sp.]
MGLELHGTRVVGASHGMRHLIATLADGREAFVKQATRRDQAAELAAEANGLRWLAEPGVIPVPRVVAVDNEALVIEMLPPGHPTREAARDLGTALARLHNAGAPSFGAPWTGFIAGLPLPNSLPGEAVPGTRPGTPDATAGLPGQPWGTWFVRCRIMPYVALARDRAGLSRADARVVAAAAARIGDIAGPPEPPARIHGDLWSGNVYWSGGKGWLIDPAAHGGHRETDLAMLALFGAPYLDEVLAAYQEMTPLADGWRARVPLHQLHPLLVHACLFGEPYGAQAAAAARAALAA